MTREFRLQKRPSNQPARLAVKTNFVKVVEAQRLKLSFILVAELRPRKQTNRHPENASLTLTYIFGIAQYLQLQNFGHRVTTAQRPFMHSTEQCEMMAMAGIGDQWIYLHTEPTEASLYYKCY